MAFGEPHMLALTKKTGYGLIAMTRLYGLPEGEVTSAREIAESYDLPTSLIMNVLKQLASAGFVEGVRGARGGYRLACRPERVSLADLIEALEGPIRLAECIAGPGKHRADREVCSIVDHCPVAGPVHRVQRKLSDFLKQVSLADIAEPAAAGDAAGS